MTIEQIAAELTLKQGQTQRDPWAQSYDVVKAFCEHLGRPLAAGLRAMRSAPKGSRKRAAYQREWDAYCRVWAYCEVQRRLIEEPPLMTYEGYEQVPYLLLRPGDVIIHGGFPVELLESQPEGNLSLRYRYRNHDGTVHWSWVERYEYALRKLPESNNQEVSLEGSTNQEGAADAARPTA